MMMRKTFFLTSQYIKKIRGKDFIIDWCYRYNDALEAIVEAGMIYILSITTWVPKPAWN